MATVPSISRGTSRMRRSSAMSGRATTGSLTLRCGYSILSRLVNTWTFPARRTWSRWSDARPHGRAERIPRPRNSTRGTGWFGRE
jgi:hypothetical protein